MHIVMQFVICALLGYLVGCINPSFLLAKIKGFDIRMQGSGNAGASNVIITIGRVAGLFCALFDIFKAFFVIKISLHLFPILKIAGILAGTCCILGHIFPITMRFQGGKGLASLGGVILAYNGKLFLTLFLLGLLTVIVLKYVCLVPTSCSLIFAIYMGITYGPMFGITFLPAVGVIIAKHIPNFKRIRYGLEARFSLLWKKEAELARIQNNWANLTDEQRQLFDMGSFGGNM